MEVSLPLLIGVVLAFLLLFVLVNVKNSCRSWWPPPEKEKKKLRLPPGPWQLPLVGSLHHVLLSRHADLPHRALRELAGKYGPLMMLRFGAVPTLVVSGAMRETERCNRSLMAIMDDIIREHGDGEEDLLGVLLRLQRNGDVQCPLTTDLITNVVLDMFAAGSETSSTTLEWALTELVRNPHIMEKAQSEVREIFRGENKLTEEMMDKLSYLRLVIRETLRLHLPVPFLLPRQCREPCSVMGYDIPVGTKVLVNAWAIARDNQYWDDPEVFKPERFENNHVDFKGIYFEFIPFGAGRRICPGIALGLANIELMLASLLYHFDWEFLDRDRNDEIDLSETFGITAKRKSKLMVYATQLVGECAPGGAGAVVPISEKISRMVNDSVVRPAIGSRCARRDEFLHVQARGLRQARGRVQLGRPVPIVVASELAQRRAAVGRPSGAAGAFARAIIYSSSASAQQAPTMGRRGSTTDELLSVLLRLQRHGGVQCSLTTDMIATVIMVTPIKQRIKQSVVLTKHFSTWTIYELTTLTEKKITLEIHSTEIFSAGSETAQRHKAQTEVREKFRDKTS
uniref:Cytochrome P450 n=1 Tax=Oryza glumipatula TaxID=40148 RepID=A0A0D9ZA57_9ORYZ